MGLGDLRQASAILSPGKKPGTLCTGGLVGPKEENLTPTRIRCPDIPARSESLCRLSCADP